MSETPERVELFRHEEQFGIGKHVATIGRVHAEKRIETDYVAEDVPRNVERADVERVPAKDGDSGRIERLPDGSVSIPLLEEELVVTKRTVVRERIVIRKEVVTERERVEAELRREEVEFERDDRPP
jgi:uncharacterized protein (TIGR02271 family)